MNLGNALAGRMCCIAAMLGLSLSACSGGSTGNQTGQKSQKISSAELQQALFANNEPDRCVQEAYNWLITAHRFGDEFHGTTNTVENLLEDDLHSSDRDRQSEALEVLRQQQRQVSDEYSAGLSDGQLNTQFRCAELHSQYTALAERLNDRSELQGAVRACADMAGRLVRMTGGDTSDGVDDQELRQCPEGLAAAAEAAGLALPRLFAQRWSSNPNAKTIEPVSSGPHLTQAMLAGAWAYGGRECSISGPTVRIDGSGNTDRPQNLRVTVLPNGNLQRSSDAGTFVDAIRVIDRDHFKLLDAGSGYEIPWERCATIEPVTSGLPASKQQQEATAVVGSAVLPKLGQCFSTSVKEVSTRLQGDTDGSSGTFVSYQDGHSQVDYVTMLTTLGFNVGDPVSLCVVSLPANCPLGDNRGVTYRTTDLATRRTWTAADSQHACGGA